MEFKAVLDAVRALSTEEQARLVDMIQDDLFSQTEPAQFSDEQATEIVRRVAAYDANPQVGAPWKNQTPLR
jgi:putative addiction module component (TIGR02574 family)